MKNYYLCDVGKRMMTMKNMKILLTAIVVIVSQSVAISNDTLSSNSKLSYEMLEAAKVINSALEVRDFQGAREGTVSLLSLIKKDLKKSRKRMTDLKKQDDMDSLKTEKAVYKRKQEIFESLTHLIEVSPAALRVKSNELAAMVLEYRQIIE